LNGRAKPRGIQVRRLCLLSSTRFSSLRRPRMVPDKRDPSGYLESARSRVIVTIVTSLSIKNEYFPLKRGRRAVTTFQLTMPPCVKSSNALRQRKQHGARSVSRRPRETPTRVKESKGWCSWRGSLSLQVRRINYIFGAICEPDFNSHFHYFFLSLYYPVKSRRHQRKVPERLFRFLSTCATCN
jgi:hypothetical protein